MKAKVLWQNLLPYLPKKKPWTICFFGLPGTGKTTYARLTLEYFRKKKEKVAYLNSDSLRRQNFEPLYTQRENILVYQMINKIAEILLEKNYNLIIDATGLHFNLRRNLQRLLKEKTTDWIQIVTQAPKAVVYERMKQRKIKEKDPFASQATPKIYLKLFQLARNDKRKNPARDKGVPLLLFSTTDGRIEKKGR